MKKKFKRKGERRKGQGEQREREKKRRKDQVNLEKNNWVAQRKMSQA